MAGHMHLTPTGRHFAKQAGELLRETGALADGWGELRGELKGPVALGCYTGLASNVLPAVLEGMASLHPRLEIRITVGDHSELLPALENGALDTAIVYEIGLPADVERRVIYKTEVMAVLGADDPLSKEDDMDLDDLAIKPLIMLNTTPSTAYTQLMFAQRGLKPNLGAVVPQIDLVRAMVGRGLGYSLLMSRPNQIPVSSEGKRLVTRHLRPRAGQTSVVDVWTKEAMPTARAMAVVQYAVEVLDANESE